MAAEMKQVELDNPFREVAYNRIGVIFLEHPPPKSLEEKGVKNEVLKPGKREIYVHYPDGMGRSKLKIPVARFGTYGRGIWDYSFLPEAPEPAEEDSGEAGDGGASGDGGSPSVEEGCGCGGGGPASLVLLLPAAWGLRRRRVPPRVSS